MNFNLDDFLHVFFRELTIDMKLIVGIQNDGFYLKIDYIILFKIVKSFESNNSQQQQQNYSERNKSLRDDLTTTRAFLHDLADNILNNGLGLWFWHFFLFSLTLDYYFLKSFFLVLTISIFFIFY